MEECNIKQEENNTQSSMEEAEHSDEEQFKITIAWRITVAWRRRVMYV